MEITLELTRKCPLQCSFCSSNAHPSYVHHVETCQWMELIDQSLALGARKICLSGGEPLEYPGYLSLLEHIRNAGLKLAVYTSGIVIKGENSRLSIPDDRTLETTAHLADEVVFGLHGPMGIHDRLTRTPGSFRFTTTALRRIRNMGGSCSIHFVPLKANIEHLDKVIDFALNEGLSQVSLLRFVPQGRGLLNKDSLELTKKDLTQFTRKIENLSQKETSILRLGTPFSFLNLGSRDGCSLGNRMTILSDGRLSLCEALKDDLLLKGAPNALEVSLKTAWQSDWTKGWLETGKKIRSRLLESKLDSCPAQIIRIEHESLELSSRIISCQKPEVLQHDR
ncbi:MAG: radical SAM protein [Candidatus Thorarchaeota archaeon]|nr:radical SAM protein [Candidatus Thorarchaeota archaeon]